MALSTLSWGRLCCLLCILLVGYRIVPECCVEFEKGGFVYYLMDCRGLIKRGLERLVECLY
jgi:hypothetical protein